LTWHAWPEISQAIGRRKSLPHVAYSQFKTTLPELPEIMAANPFSYSV